jgi:hypothetical protein
VKHQALIFQAVHRWRGSVTATGFVRAFFLLLFAVLASTAIAPAAENFPAQNIPASPAVRSALDDLDGDFRPDQIAVQTGNSEFSGTQYWIELQLSSAGRQRIPVFSLPGGIQVVARDVNGNGKLDLVLTTTSLRLPVAVLLNDGHGQFTRVEPEAFPSAFQDAGTSWESREHSPDDCAGLLRSWRSPIVLAASTSPVAPALAGHVGPSNHIIVVSLKATPDSGRAPPAPALL